MSRAVFEVIPQNDGLWVIRMPSDSVWELHNDKGVAIRRARELGRRYESWRIHVLTKNGAVETELSSAESPSPSS